MPLQDSILAGYEGRQFETVRYGERKVVQLVKVKRDKVQLRHPDRVDSFTLSMSEFLKFYKIIPGGNI